jgi:hypothetical protein
MANCIRQEGTVWQYESRYRKYFRGFGSLSTDCPSLEKNAAALLFWGTDHGVSKGNLVMGLQHSILLRDTVLVIFISIGEMMTTSTSKPFNLYMRVD